MNSKDIHALYHGNLRDVHVYELTDAAGIQVVRKYPSAEKCPDDSRMFMRLYLKKEYGVMYMIGGVDMVKTSEDPANFKWTVVTTDRRVYRKPTNYSFGTDEQIRFNDVSKKVLFRGRSITITECIEQLEKNHLRDLFFASRTANALTALTLHILFFLGDTKYEWSKLLLTNQGGLRDRKESIALISPERDPYFHYFSINKNLFAVALALFLYPLYEWSRTLPHGFFTIENPFIIACFLLGLSVLGVLGDLLKKFLASSYVKMLVLATLQSRGKLRLYPN